MNSLSGMIDQTGRYRTGQESAGWDDTRSWCSTRSEHVALRSIHAGSFVAQVWRIKVHRHYYDLLTNRSGRSVNTHMRPPPVVMTCPGTL